ncbi:MAG TPA: type VI secretion system-associated FHA domain protein [Polyangiaceae bacterium]
MPRGFIVHCEQQNKEFPGLPIRIGRNALNDFSLPLKSVSDFHARIEEAQERIFIVDLNSRNGVFLRHSDGNPVRIGAGERVDLAPFGNEFFIGPHILVRLEIVEVSQSRYERAFAGTVLGNKNLIEADRGSLPPLGDIQSLPPLTGAKPNRPSTRPARSGGFAPVEPRASPLSSDPRGETQHFDMNLEALALTGLRELTASLLPGRDIQTTGDLARLVTRLHDTVEVFCRCFIPLREGHAQFVSNFDLRRDASQRASHRSQGYARVEAARTPDEVATALLDFRDTSLDSASAIEGIFADLMVHQVALLEGVMRGVRALLDELSPSNIEEEVESSHSLLALTLGRNRALWEEFCERYEQLSQEKQALERIFGPEFADAYENYTRKRTV